MNHEQYPSLFEKALLVDIYPNVGIGFQVNGCCVEINTQQFGLILKFLQGMVSQGYFCLLALPILSFVFGLAVTIYHSLMLIANDYLKLYFVLAIVSNIIALSLRTYLRKSDHYSYEKLPSLSAYETAYLAGGQERTIDTAIISLVQDEALKAYPEIRSLKLKNKLPQISHPLEKEIFQTVRFNGSITQIRTTVARATFPIYHRLVNLGLIISLDQAKSVQLWSAMPVLILLLVGIGMIATSIYQNQPIGFLLLFWILTAIIGYTFLFVPVHRSLYGDRILEDLRSTYGNYETLINIDNTVQNSQLLMGFALFGIKALINSPLNDLRQLCVYRWGIDSKRRLCQWFTYTTALYLH